MDQPPSFDSFPSHLTQSSSLTVPSIDIPPPNQTSNSKSNSDKKRKSRSDTKRAKKHPTQTSSNPTRDSKQEDDKNQESSHDPADTFLNSLGLEKKLKLIEDEFKQSKKIKIENELKSSNSLNQSLLYSNLEEKKSFYIDLREDTFNLHHGKPDKGKVPNYRRIGAGRVIGIHPRWRITLDSAYRGNGLRLSEEGRRKAISITDEATFQLLNDKNLKRIVISKPSSTSSTGPAASLSAEGQTCPPPKPEPRSIFDETYAEDVDSDGDAFDYLPPEEDGGESVLDRLNKLKGDLERKSKDDPSDIRDALVNLQDEMKELGMVGLRAKQNDVDPDAAQKHVQGTSFEGKSNQNNESILLAYMRAYCDQPDVECSQEWRKMLDSHPGVTGLWVAYVDWRQTDAGSMNVTEMVEVYEELIDRLVRRAEADKTNDGGFHERAVAAFQAVIELNFLGPVTLKSFGTQRIPRIGEAGSIGWSRYSPDVEFSPPSPVLPAFGIESRPLQFGAWQETELTVLGPTRTIDPDSDDDPFRCVLFDDLRNLLFRVSKFDSKQALLYSFLSFMGLCLPPPDVDTNVAFFTDPFLSSEICDTVERQSFFWPKIELVTSVDINGMRQSLSGIRDPLKTPFRVFPSDQRQLFSDPAKWFTSFIPKTSDIPFIQNALALLRTSTALKNDLYFTLCVIAFEARLDQDQSCLLLWDTYARLCLLKGKVKTARDVYVKTLSLIEEERQDLNLIWYSWTEMEFELGNFGLAARILARATKCLDVTPTVLAATTAEQPAATVLLRTRRAFTSRISTVFHSDVPQDMIRQRVSDATAFATLQYTTEGFEPACEVFETTIKAIEDLNSLAEEEELWMNYCRMIYQHIQKHRSYKPFELRTILKRSVEKFRNNSVFLALFAFNESRMKIDNETRRLIEGCLLKDELRVTSNSWLFAIWVEMHLNVTGYNQVAVSRLFERALLNQRTKSSVQLWRLYIEFEIRNGNYTRARSIITRSHAACPWVKDLYLLPFSTTLSTVYHNVTEQKRMLRLCDEKGIRIKDRKIFKVIEEIEIEIEKLEEDGEEEEEMLVEELEQRKELEERKRLLPY
ncbi:NRDE-2, necessary for RNA interference-domain-containing protein [Melampsora americana]|nr:NRDE-2, necessary for RNA interference-domain-containing protein [Melampsora americana]